MGLIGAGERGWDTGGLETLSENDEGGGGTKTKTMGTSWCP